MGSLLILISPENLRLLQNNGLLGMRAGETWRFEYLVQVHKVNSFVKLANLMD